MVSLSIPSMLRQCVNLHPDGTAFTYIDYERDSEGISESLTWSQVYRRTLNVAAEVRRHAAIGDRAVILAPQGLDYIVAFLGALQAGLIAVPLSAPLGGASDERVDAVVRDAKPNVVLTTSAIMGDVVPRVTPPPGIASPPTVAVDQLDLDSPIRSNIVDDSLQTTAYLQYTSGSTRTPAGVMITYKNILANFQQMISAYFADTGAVPPLDLFIMSWLPFYHDMGLVLGVCAPIIVGCGAVLTSPVAFLQRPARWLQLMAREGQAFSAAPNFAFELTAAKAIDDDLAGLDLGRIKTILCGSERVHPATLKRFVDRFSRFNLREFAIRPAYGLAEATVYVATSQAGQPPEIRYFEPHELSAGQAKPCATGAGTALVSYPLPQSPIVRIVDPNTNTECPPGTIGEIWVHGDNVAGGYWEKPDETERTFGGALVAPSAGTPVGPWLRTGDSGFVSEDKFFIIGRIKDLLIVYGRNHSPDDIEATIQEITRGRCAAIAVPSHGVEKLVAIVELNNRGNLDTERLSFVTREVTSAISTSHGLSVSDLVLVAPGSIPITTSGKVRRAECVKLYRHNEFTRLDAKPLQASDL
ncbi:fatty-acid-AMP ligase FadD23 [Mycobacterium tuberculosis TKK-01-0058]|uniref:long-chain-fatty-acid--CoA ligase FadD23 n=1 Tax=Mycobacterium tuberculosis TaxID=1773 RepID=UPI0004595ABD|nr:long-chain-fatty-acid--CoA ligase FadD23 [Mycobacterium tuberculosis]KBZ86359.1 fatty-acid-AMP ligase FadD23 [Mycobacterium tuberculosis TKK-01-0058]